MSVRLVAYRRSSTAADASDLTQYELDLQKEPNVVTNYKWLDLKEPDKRKSSFSQTIKIPFTNRNNQFFENWFDVNLETLVFNVSRKFNAILYVNSVPQLQGYVQLKSIYLNARLYECVIFGQTADFFTDIKTKKLKDAFTIEDEDNPGTYLDDPTYDHILSLENIVDSWSAPGIETVGGSNTTDIMYPIIDYGHTTNPYSSAMFWKPEDITDAIDELGDQNYLQGMNWFGIVRGTDLKPAMRIQTLFHLIAKKAGYQIKSAFMGINDTAGTPITDTSYFSRLFMTCESGSGRVKSLWNISTGSEAPFVGFEANMSAPVTHNTHITPDGEGGIFGQAYGVYSAGNGLYVNNEVYDPNSLYSISNGQFDYGWDIEFNFDLPVVTIPLSEDGSMLPSGNMSVKTTINLDVPSTYNYNSGADTGSLDNLEFRIVWKECAFGGDAPFNAYDMTAVADGYFVLTPGNNQTITCTVPLPCVPGTHYGLQLVVCSTQGLAASPIKSANITVNSCTIETLQTDELGFMEGAENGEVQMYHNVPDITQSDFVKDLVNRFNLIIKSDEGNERLLLIEPYQDYIDAGSTNYWTDKLDTSKEMVIKSTNELQSRFLEFKDLDDTDFFNKRYKDIYNVTYGSYREMRHNDFAKKEWKNFSVFSPFIAQGINYWGLDGISGNLPEANVAIAYLFRAELGGEAEVATDLKPKLFYYSGVPITISGSNPNSGNAYDFKIWSSKIILGDSSEVYDTNNKFPICTQFNINTVTAVTSSTKTFHWHWYNPSFNSGFTSNYFGNEYTEKGLFNDFWRQYINEIYSSEARIMECYLKLNEEDINSFAGAGFKDTYYIKNTLWRVISVDGHLVGGNKSTKVKLLKVIEKLTNDCGNTPTVTDSGLITWVDSATGASVAKVTNACCEGSSPYWTFVQTNATTGEGDCYATGIEDNDSVSPAFMPTLPGGASQVLGGGNAGSIALGMPTSQNNLFITNSNGIAQTTTFYLEATTLDDVNRCYINFNGVQSQVFSIKQNTMNFMKVTVLGSVVAGTNNTKCGQYEYDTILLNRGAGSEYIGTAGGNLRSTSKDAAFSNPTLDITNFNKVRWSPTIVGGANEKIHWIFKVEALIQKTGNPDYNFPTRAIFQNGSNIILQDLNQLLWN